MVKKNAPFPLFENLLSSFSGITEKVKDEVLSTAKEKQTSGKSTILLAGASASKIFFIEKGLLRGFRVIDGAEYTHHFFFEGWFATDFKSFLSGEKSELTLECLTDTTYLEFSKPDLETLYRKHHSLESLGRKIAERAFLEMVNRSNSFQTNKLLERYRDLMSRSPELLQMVPQKYIASYLGVSEQSLSRIKAEL